MVQGETVEWRGVRELIAACKAVDADLVTEIKVAGRLAAKEVADEAKQLVPVVSGALQRSIKPSSTQKGASVKAGASLPYAGPIHFGWAAHNIEPQPFLYDALDARREAVLAVYERNLDAILRREF